MASTGGTWIDTIQKSFVDVPIDTNNDNAIATTDFLEASESLATLFGGLISNVYAFPHFLTKESQMSWAPLRSHR